MSGNFRTSYVTRRVKIIELIVNWNEKLAAIFEDGYECFLQVAAAFFYKMDVKNTA